MKARKGAAPHSVGSAYAESVGKHRDLPPALSFAQLLAADPTPGKTILEYLLAIEWGEPASEVLRRIAADFNRVAEIARVTEGNTHLIQRFRGQRAGAGGAS